MLRKFILAGLFLYTMLPVGAHAEGCIKGAAVGGVAGHVAGGHGLVGAAAGCAIEHHREKKAKSNAAKAAAATTPAPTASVPSK